MFFFFFSFFLIRGGTRSLRMDYVMRRRSTVGGALEMFSLPLPLPLALKPASQAGPMRNPREGTSVVLRDTIRLT